MIVYVRFSSISGGGYWTLLIIKSRQQNMYESSPWIRLTTLPYLVKICQSVGEVSA
jgi:hypothetical protein